MANDLTDILDVIIIIIKKKVHSLKGKTGEKTTVISVDFVLTAKKGHFW